METFLFRFISVEIPIITQPHLECSNGYISIKQIKMQLLLDKRVVLVHIHGKKKESMHQNRKLRLLSMCKPCIFILNAPSIKISRPHWNKKLTVGNIFFYIKICLNYTIERNLSLSKTALIKSRTLKLLFKKRPLSVVWQPRWPVRILFLFSKPFN